MSDIGGTNPLEPGVAWAIDRDTDFIGKEFLEKAKEAGINRKILGFILDSREDEIAIQDADPILYKNTKVGKVVTIVYGFTVEKYIGDALVDSNKVKIGEKITLNNYEGELTESIFYTPDNSNLTQ